MQRFTSRFGWSRRYTLAMILSCLVSQAGCSLFPNPVVNWNALDPAARSEWAEDEEYAVTWHQQETQLNELRRDAAGMSIADRSSHASALAENLQQETNSVLRTSLVQTLATFDVPEAMAGLESVSEDDDPQIRMAACEALGLQSSPRRVSLLIRRVLGDTNKDVQMAAMRSLASCRGAAAQREIHTALRDVLDDDDPAIQYSAVEALEGSSGVDLGANISLWRQVLDRKVPLAAAKQQAQSRQGGYWEQLQHEGLSFNDLMPWNWF
jgi:hypothetical protein